MYFVKELFVKRGQLGFVWLAGTGATKLPKKTVLGADVVKMCGDIKQPPGGAPLALPARARLFLGVCRILERKAKYLLMDAVEAQSKVQLHLTSASLNLPPGSRRHDNISIVMEIDDVLSELPPIPLYGVDNISSHEDMASGAIDIARADDKEGEKSDTFLDEENTVDVGEFMAKSEDITMEEFQDELVPMHSDSLGGDFETMSASGRSGIDLSLPSPNAFIDLPSIEDLDLTGLDQHGDEQHTPLIDILNPNAAITINTEANTHTQNTIKSAVTSKTRYTKYSSNSKRGMSHRVDASIAISSASIRSLLADASSLLIQRPTKLRRVCVTQSHCHISNEACPQLQDFLERMSCMARQEKREVCEAEKHAAMSIGHTHNVQQADNELYYTSGPYDEDGAAHHSASISASDMPSMRYSDAASDIEQSRANLLPIVEPEHEDLSVFLGHKLSIDEQQYGVNEADNDTWSRRQSRVSFQSVSSRAGSAASPIHEDMEARIDTPDYRVSLSQFEIPEMIVEDDDCNRISSKWSRRKSIDRTTEILRTVLHDGFATACVAASASETKRDEGAPISLNFHTVLDDAMCGARVRRRDAALSFLQLLVLKTMSMVDISQDEPYGPIKITQTTRFEESFAASQFDSGNMM